MPRLLCCLLALFLSGCGKNSVDPAEITWVFNRHSYAEQDLPRMEAGLQKSGPSVLSSFDHYALFFPPRWHPAPVSAGLGKAGVGLVLWRAGNEAVVVRVFPRSPAEAAGLKRGDRIFSVDGQPVADLPEAAMGAAIYGSLGGVFLLKGEKRDGGELDSSLKREYGGMPTVWGFNVPGTRTGYLRIVNFSGKTAARLKAEMNDLLDGGADRVIIDLRGNYGGSLDQLSASLALFAGREAELFKAVSRHTGYSRVFASRDPGPYAGLKTLLLTDAGTLSRGEVFAAALREWGGAALVGEATAGNVSATRGFKLKSGAALRITVARLLTPAGLDLDGRGLTPDVAVQCPASADRAGFREFPSALASSDPVLQAALSAP